jgi:C1A family cysteine protease
MRDNPMPETAIANVPQLGPFRNHLATLGYKNTDTLFGAVRASGDVLASYLGVSRAELDALVAQIPQSPRPVRIAGQRRFALGVRIDKVPRHRRAFTIAAVAVPLPPLVNLLAEMQPVRDQGGRGTCVAHASTAAAEHYWRSQGQILDLSRQFLYWDCKQHDGDPTGEGTWVGVAMPLLQSDGCCLETSWPYVMTAIVGNESQDPPPPAAAAGAAQYRIPSFRQISPTSVMDIKSELAQGRCVAFSIPVFDSWYQNDEVTRSGEIINPIPNEEDVGGHAMCFIGYEDLPSEDDLGGGRFYLRNSWDSMWATQSVLGSPGYGTIPYSYIQRFGTEAFSVG